MENAAMAGSEEGARRLENAAEVEWWAHESTKDVNAAEAAWRAPKGTKVGMGRCCMHDGGG